MMTETYYQKEWFEDYKCLIMVSLTQSTEFPITGGAQYKLSDSMTGSQYGKKFSPVGKRSDSESIKKLRMRQRFKSAECAEVKWERGTITLLAIYI